MSYSSSSGKSVSIGVYPPADVGRAEDGPCSRGMVRTERGRLPRAFFLGLGGGAIFTGEGEREGSFSFEGMFSPSSSFSSPSSSDGESGYVEASCGCGVNRDDDDDAAEARPTWFVVSCCSLLGFFFIVTDWTLVPFRDREERESSCCS